MDPSDKTPHPDDSPAGDCALRVRLSAYHDGELDSATAALITRHLGTCDICRTDLTEIRELSTLAEMIGDEGISPSALRAVHRRIEADPGVSIFRIAGVLSGLAASALVIGAVWLSEMAKSQPGPVQHRMVMIEAGSAWESVAINLQSDPLPQAGWDKQNQQMLADARLANWMVNSLNGNAHEK